MSLFIFFGKTGPLAKWKRLVLLLDDILSCFPLVEVSPKYVTAQDLTIFPGEATWKRVKQCTTGRVYILEFKEDRRLFFWLQEPSDEKDDENAAKINQYINNPPAAGSAGNAKSCGSYASVSDCSTR